MEKQANQSDPADTRTDVQLDDLNERIDAAIARFDQMRRDFQFLAGTNWREPKS